MNCKNFIYTDLHYIAYNKFSEYWECKPRIIYDYELFFITSGSGSININEKDYLYAENDVILVPPNVTHSMHSIDLPIEITCVHFDIYGSGSTSTPTVTPYQEDSPTQIIHANLFPSPKYLNNLQLEKCSISLPIISSPKSKPLAAAINTLVSEISKSDNKDMLSIQQLIINIVSGMHGASRHDIDSPESVTAIVSYIEENYSHRISLNTLSKILHLQPTYISQLFKKHYNISLSEFIKLYRISVAKALLLNSHDKLENIAVSAGFYDSAQFCKEFMRCEGITPTVYRNINRERIFKV